jgi:hypothetical protein
MKKSYLRTSLVAISAALSSSQAFAQTTLSFNVPANTTWTYMQKISTKTAPLEPVLVAETGKKVPAKLEKSLKKGLGTSVSASRNVITEKVVGIKDASSTVAVNVTSTTATVNSGQKPTKQNSKWSFNRIYQSDGKVSVSDFVYDTKGLTQDALNALKNQSANAKNAELARFQQLYGLPLTEATLVGSSSEYTRNVSYDAKKPVLSVKVSSSKTFKGRGDKEQFIFKTNATVESYTYAKTVRKNDFTYRFDPTKSSSEETYLPDGRLERSSGTSTSTSTISYLTTFAGVKVTVKLGFTSTTETVTELQP